MKKANDSRAAWADNETLKLVRPEVREILESAQAFKRMTPEEQKDLARTMVKVAAYMANPDGLAPQLVEQNAKSRALADADATEETRKRLSQKPGSTGADFQAGAVNAGVDAFTKLVKAVDFPQFVSGLIKGVFQAIVESSIQQMRAYGELLANVAKSVDQFAQDNISENNARDWLAQRFPDQVQVDTSQSSSFALAEGDDTPAPTPVLVPRDGVDAEEAAQKISTELQLPKPIGDLSEEVNEKALVLAARLEMARSRQQLLASMVMLGINRIVITDGLINAKVVFSMRASDVAKREATASMYDRRNEYTKSSTSAEYGGWMSPVDVSYTNESGSNHVATVSSSVDDTSESKAEVKAQLTGEVKVNFKSDYFPMDKLANPQMIAAIQGNAQPVEKGKTVAA
jgi:hypothetical protein